MTTARVLRRKVNVEVISIKFELNVFASGFRCDLLVDLLSLFKEVHELAAFLLLLLLFSRQSEVALLLFDGLEKGTEQTGLRLREGAHRLYGFQA